MCDMHIEKNKLGDTMCLYIKIEQSKLGDTSCLHINIEQSKLGGTSCLHIKQSKLGDTSCLHLLQIAKLNLCFLHRLAHPIGFTEHAAEAGLAVGSFGPLLEVLIRFRCPFHQKRLARFHRVHLLCSCSQHLQLLAPLQWSPSFVSCVDQS